MAGGYSTRPRLGLGAVTQHVTLVVAATEAEAAHVPQHLRVVITGLGKTDAAVATTRALAQVDPARTRVLNIGTAGALRDGVQGLHLPGVVLNHDLSAEAIRALGYDPEERLVLEGGDGTVLASGDVFVTDPDDRAALGGGALLVSMEGYAVPYACRRMGLPVQLVRHVSDNREAFALDWRSRV